MPTLFDRSRLFAAFAIFAAFYAETAGAAERPNVLWIVADDLGPELGCHGYAGVATPQIDRLAAGGVRFTRAFATAPVCSPSRSAFITGMYQTAIGAHHHRTEIPRPLPVPVKPVTDLFHAAGYRTCNSAGPPNFEKPGKIDYNFVHDPKQLFDGADWRNRAENQPFFAQIQIKEPHRPFVKSDKPCPAEAKIPAFYPDHPVTRADWANYLASIEVLDTKVGEILDRLDAEGLTDNTVVFFFGDHGRPHVRGKQWLYEGGLHIPLIVRWPGKLAPGGVDERLVSMIDLAPASLAAAGIAVPAWMQGRDLFAADFANGRDAVYAARDRCGDALDRIRCVRTERWKYIRNFEPERSYSQVSSYKKLQYPVLTLMAVMHAQGRLDGAQEAWFAETRPSEELYDLDADPDERHNLASDPAHAETLAELRGKLETWLAETGDQGAEPEGDAAFFEELLANSRRYYENGMKRKKLAPDISDRDYLEWWERELGIKE